MKCSHYYQKYEPEVINQLIEFQYSTWHLIYLHVLIAHHAWKQSHDAPYPLHFVSSQQD